MMTIKKLEEAEKKFKRKEYFELMCATKPEGHIFTYDGVDYMILTSMVIGEVYTDELYFRGINF